MRPPRFLAYPDSLARLQGTRLLANERDTGNINIAPQLSPDGRTIAYLSERDLFGIDLYLADAVSGEVIDKLASVGSDPHTDALRFIESAGTWRPDGAQFAFVVFAGGNNEISVLDVASRRVVRRRLDRGRGLTPPELAVLMAWTKIVLADELLEGDLPDDPYLDIDLKAYFPTPMRERFEAQIEAHPLRREIIVTQVVNDLVNGAGMTYWPRLAEETGRDVLTDPRAQLDVQLALLILRLEGRLPAGPPS